MAAFNFLGDQYKWFGKERRKQDDPDYSGPERRIEKKRQMIVDQIIKQLEKQVQ
jgi:hypothetical protein